MTELHQPAPPTTGNGNDARHRPYPVSHDRTPITTEHSTPDNSHIVRRTGDGIKALRPLRGRARARALTPTP
jgi:hypothetical protein